MVKATTTEGVAGERMARVRHTSKMTFKQAVMFRLAQTGVKKKFLAAKIGLSAVEFSLLLSGKRKYPNEKILLIRELGLTEYRNMPSK